MNTWKTLSAINVNDHKQMKGKFNYLSWTWAWATLMDNYPDSTYEFLPNEDSWRWISNYALYCDGTRKVSHTMWLAVTDFNNKAIMNPNCHDIANNKMRCLTKALAFHGLGHYIYANESLPEESEAVRTAVIDDKQAEEIKGLLAEYKIDVKAFLKYFKTSSVDLMLASNYTRAIATLQAKAPK
jgi:hypothetical protein